MSSERFHVAAALTAVALLGLCAACKKDPPAAPAATGGASQIVPDGAATIPGAGVAPVDGGLASAAVVPPIEPPKPGDLIATVETSMGTFQIRLFADKAPATVANFVGLADGTKPWREPRAGQASAAPTATAPKTLPPEVKRPFYDGLPVFRVAPDFIIQSGDPLSDGTGGPGYTLPDELRADLRHDRPGVVTMAHRGRGTGGSQFMILLRALPVLDGRNSVFGEIVTGLEVVRAISRVPVDKQKPLAPVVIRRVSVKKLA